LPINLLCHDTIKTLRLENLGQVKMFQGIVCLVLTILLGYQVNRTKNLISTSKLNFEHSQCVDIKFTPDERLSDCEDLPSFRNLLDMNLTFEQITDEIAELNGYAIMRPELKPHLPLQFVATSEYFDRGTWIPGPGYTTLDACSELANPKRPWFAMAQAFVGDLKRCPFKAGDVFHFDNYQYETILRKANAMYAGQWRVKSTLSQVGIGHSKKYCCIGKYSVTLV
jgi:hypothetical protein